MGSRPSVWPALTVRGAAVGGSWTPGCAPWHHRASRRRSQVTYDGHPLYYYAGDGLSGQTAEQSIAELGAKW
jgi:hypothetical protein